MYTRWRKWGIACSPRLSLGSSLGSAAAGGFLRPPFAVSLRCWYLPPRLLERAARHTRCPACGDHHRPVSIMIGRGAGILMAGPWRVRLGVVEGLRSRPRCHCSSRCSRAATGKVPPKRARRVRVGFLGFMSLAAPNGAAWVRPSTQNRRARCYCAVAPPHSMIVRKARGADPRLAWGVGTGAMSK